MLFLYLSLLYIYYNKIFHKLQVVSSKSFTKANRSSGSKELIIISILVIFSGRLSPCRHACSNSRTFFAIFSKSLFFIFYLSPYIYYYNKIFLKLQVVSDYNHYLIVRYSSSVMTVTPSSLALIDFAEDESSLLIR